MIPPFKLLVHGWSKIKALLVRLESQITASKLATQNSCEAEPDNHKDTTAAPLLLEQDNAASFREPNHPEDAKGLKRLATRVAHLQCLHDFVQTDLAHLIGFRMKVASGTLKTVTFEEVYHLFSPGDLILSASMGENQLSKVYSVSGGRMRLMKKNTPHVRYRSPSSDSDREETNADAGLGTWTDVIVDAFFIVDDGTNIGPVQLTIRIKHFTGERPITHLEAYPVRFHPKSAEICERLESRGKAYMQSSGHKKYEGPDMAPWQALVPGRSRYKPSRVSRRPEFPTQGLFQGTEDIQSDVYIDFKEFYSEKNDGGLAMGRLQISPYNRRETTESLTGKLDREILCGDFDVDEARTRTFLLEQRGAMQLRSRKLGPDPAHLRLLPYQVPAYEFRSRRWVWTSIDGIEEIDKTEQARQSGWNDLVIPEEYRRLLVSLIDNHTSGVENKEQKVDPKSNLSMQIDLVRGKGRGLIVLLHGPPGSGKTSTAETIAAYSGRPLYSITCGDIGTHAEAVEQNLQYHTRLAEKWGCVLLLDEADVFLMRRSWDDMYRNALVSVFLRHLEYYSGILFLTTNIVGVIDEAFKSRIHIALRYPSIDLDSTLKIWSNLLNRIAKDNETAEVKTEFDRTRLLDFARQHYQKHEADDTTWNARQIRNAFQTAIALGGHERLQRMKDEGLTPEQAMASRDKRMKAVRLTKRNFGIIAKTARDFEDYITSIRGPDRQVALTSQQRHDDFGKDIPRARKDYPSRRRGGREKAAAKKEHGGSPSAARPRRGRETAKKTTYHEDDDDDDDEEEEKQEGGSGFGRGDETLNDDDDDDSDGY
ncbi:P-loop containing nucleoside triphosphate hydrolase protein [Colletotrichum caudatum]|nr:P-loop containing nucleoside triphosphate hydrolase protein [Colletotrichum caudatum]